MKKIMAIVLSVSVLFLATSCATQEEQTNRESNVESQEENTTTTNEQGDVAQQNILIAYFTWGDNTIVENPEEVDVDASSSASVLQPGNVATLATNIQEEIGGDLFSIQVTEPYSSDYDECLDRAADEKAEDARPQLENLVENIDAYDTVFIGYPNWWYTTPMAVLSFIENHDLSNKNIVLFSSHGTSGLANSVADITDVLPDSVRIEENVVGVYRDEMDDATTIIRDWLEEIGYL